MSSEMAKIADDLDNFVHDLREEGSSDATALWVEKRASALRRIAAAGEQKPVGWRILCTDKSRGSTGYYYTEQLPFEPGDNLRQRIEPQPLYTAPQPAPGWDEAVDACKEIAKQHVEYVDEGGLADEWVAQGIFAAIEALRPHASDCDKQECMGDQSPSDPKDLKELLSTPSVLEPSDRPADVTESELAEAARKALLAKRMHIPRSTLNLIVSALLAAFTVGRR